MSEATERQREFVELPASELVRRHGSTETWWVRHRRELVAAGVLVKVGRKFFGDPSSITTWLRQRGSHDVTGWTDARRAGGLP